MHHMPGGERNQLGDVVPRSWRLAPLTTPIRHASPKAGRPWAVAPSFFFCRMGGLLSETCRDRS